MNRPRTPTIPLQQRWDAAVHKTDTCWLWRGAVGKNGYGTINAYGERKAAHRLSWEMAKRTPEIDAAIHALRAQGYSYERIAPAVNLSASTVRNVLCSGNPRT